jgi:hypothetical protein
MSEINELYRTLLQHKSEIDSSLAIFESSHEAPSIAVQQRVSWLLAEFSKSLDRLKELTKKLDAKSKTIWETRVSRFTEDLRVVKVSCDRRMGLLFKSQREQEDRAYLFGNSASARAGDQQSQLLAERSSLNSSNNMMDAITGQSRAILDGILGQNATLKNARGKLYDLLNNAGVGQTLATSIHSRERADALILYACMGFTLLGIFLLWWFVA